jgi:membrane protein
VDPAKKTREPPSLPGRQSLRSELVAAGRRVKGVAFPTLRASVRDRISLVAASLAFHWFLAIFPLMIALLGVVGLVGLSAGELRALVQAIGAVMPVQAAQVLDEALRFSGSRPTSLAEIGAGGLVALWSGVEAMASLQVGLDVAYEVSGDRGFVGRRVRAIPLLGASALAGGSSAILLVLGDPIYGLLRAHVALAAPLFLVLWNVGRWLAALILVVLLFSFYFWFGPRREAARWRWVSPGAVVAAALWVAASGGFSFYLDRFGHESRTYGAFAGVALLLLWLYIAALAVLLGAELNRTLEVTAETGGR